MAGLMAKEWIRLKGWKPHMGSAFILTVSGISLTETDYIKE